VKKKSLVFSTLLLGISLLLSGCLLRNRINPGISATQPAIPSNPPLTQSTQTSAQVQAMPVPPSTQVQAQPTPRGPGLDESVAGLDQALKDLQSTLQAAVVPTPASSVDLNVNSADPDLDSLQQALQAEPAP
jgi:hypothetical protein